MGLFRRMTAVLLVGLVAAVACRVAIESTTTQPAISFPSNTVFTAPVNGSTVLPIVISPASDKVASSDRILAISPIGACPGWKLNLPALPATVINSCGSASGSALPQQAAPTCVASTLQFMPEFAPKDPGSTSCTLKIDTDTGAQSLTLTGMALPLTVDLRLAEGVTDPVSCNPCSVDFSDVDVGTSSVPTTLELLNVGTDKATVTQITISNPIFEIVGGDPGVLTIPGGEKTPIQVQCHPITPTSVVTGTLTIESDNLNTQVAQTLVMTCRGIQSDLQFLSSATAISQIDLTTRVHEPRSQTIALKNKGTALMTVNELVVTVPNADVSFDKAPPIIIAPGDQTDLTIAFTPTQPVADLGTLVVKFDASQRELALTGGALATELETVLDPPSLGKLCIGDRRLVTITARATGEGNVGLQDIDAVDPDHAPFTLSIAEMNPLPFRLLGGRRNEATFTVDASPTSVQNMSIVLITDIPRPSSSSTVVVVDLPAEILPEGVAGPESTVFQEVELGSEAFARAIEISNCSDQAVSITGASVSNDDFEIVDGDFTQIEPRATVTYQVVMKTSVPGAKVASLTVRTTEADVDVSLSGEVLGAEARDSYYACSSSNPGGWLLVVCFVGLVLRRPTRGGDKTSRG